MLALKAAFSFPSIHSFVGSILHWDTSNLMSGAALRILRMRGGISCISMHGPLPLIEIVPGFLGGSKSCPRHHRLRRGRSDCNSLSRLSPLTVVRTRDRSDQKRVAEHFPKPFERSAHGGLAQETNFARAVTCALQKRM